MRAAFTPVGADVSGLAGAQLALTLRVGVLFAAGQLEDWQLQTVRELQAVPGVVVSPVISVADTQPASESDPALWRIYRGLAAKLHPQSRSQLVTEDGALEPMPLVEARLVRRQGRTELSVGQTSVTGEPLDLLLSFLPASLADLSLPRLRYGTWAFRSLAHPSAPVGLWESLTGQPWTGVALIRQDADRRLLTIRSARFHTVPHSYSETRDQALAASTTWPALAARLLLHGLDTDVFQPAAKISAGAAERGVSREARKAASGSSTPRDATVTNSGVARHLVRRVQRTLEKQAADLFGASQTGADEWAIGVTPLTVEQLLAGRAHVPVRWIEAPPGRYFADPFVFTAGETSCIFLEDYDRATRKGSIAVVQTTDFCSFTAARTVIDQPFHLSYPCVFDYEGSIYLVPEQHHSGEIAIYQAEQFPDRWVKRATLVDDFPGVDPTLFEHEGTWWMFATNRRNQDVSNLYLFSAPTPLGPWTPHPQNPVKCARDRARPAGFPLVINGALCRPSQDSTRSYGGRIELHRIDVLSRSAYREELLGVIEADAEWPFAAGLHTMNRGPGVTIVDAKRRALVKHRPAQVARRKLRTLVSSLR